MMTPRSRPGRPAHTGCLSYYFHRHTQLSAAHAAYELISLAQGQPRVVGLATIEPYTELAARRDLKAVFAAIGPAHALAS